MRTVISFRESGTKHGAPPEAGRYATFDHIVTNIYNFDDRISDLYTDTLTNHATNHYPMFLHIKVLGPTKNQNTNYKVERMFFSPTERGNKRNT